MKKKWLLGLLALCMSVSTLALVGCGEKDGENDGGNIEQGGGGVETPISYTVVYETNGGSFSDGTTRMSVTVVENGKLSAPEAPIRAGYSFIGWDSENGEDTWDFTTDTITGNITLYAMWEQKPVVIVSVDGATIEEDVISMFVDKDTDSVSLADKVVCSEDTTWKLCYDMLGEMEISDKIAVGQDGVLQDGDNEFYLIVGSIDGTKVVVYELNVFRSFPVVVSYMNGESLLKEEFGYAGCEYVAEYMPQITGYTFNYWETSDGARYQTQKLWTGISLTANKTPNDYTVSYDVNEGDELSSLGEQLVYDREYTLATPTRTGYTFLGWSYKGTLLTDESGKSILPWAIAEDITVKAEWKVNGYPVLLDRYEIGGEVSGADTYDYNGDVSITASTAGGYVWLGWYNGEELLTNELTYEFKMPAEEVFYTARWIAVPVVESNNSKAGSVSVLNGQYVVGQEATITATTLDCVYEFKGWYDGEEELTKELSYTFQMPAKKVTYTAKWEVIAGMELFVVYSSDETTCTITALRDKTIEELVIPNCVTSIGYGAFQFNDTLKSVIIGDGVTSIGEVAFDDCSNLTRVVLGDNVESIDMYAFRSCKNLTSIEISNSVKSIGMYAFYNCSSLTSVVIPKDVTSIAKDVFSKCNNVTIYCEAEAQPNGWDSQWNESNRPVYWYSKNEPTTAGNYWHYVNGEPTKW